jgi:hypothetical protein
MYSKKDAALTYFCNFMFAAYNYKCIWENNYFYFFKHANKDDWWKIQHKFFFFYSLYLVQNKLQQRIQLMWNAESAIAQFTVNSFAAYVC